MNIKDWIVHPFAILSSSSKPINTIEQRQYLYDQERQLEKSVRYQEWISDSINKLVNSRENQIKSILEYQNNKQSIQIQAIEDIWWWINWLWNKIDSWMEILSNWLQQLNETQLLWFQEELKALWILDYNINTWFNNLLNSIESQTIIFQNVSTQIWEIIETLHNPRKIEWLEYKKDAISNLQNKWFEEALEYFNLASEKLTTDQEVFFLIWLIEFEENKNYDKAITNFEKAIKYAKWYNDRNIYAQSLDKLASTIYILNWKKWEINKIKKSYDRQLLAVINTDSSNSDYIYDLLKYSAIIWEYNTFEENLYKLFKLNSSLILNISIDPIFSQNPKILKIIDLVISKNKIKQEKIKNPEIKNNDIYWMFTNILFTREVVVILDFYIRRQKAIFNIKEEYVNFLKYLSENFNIIRENDQKIFFEIRHNKKIKLISINKINLELKWIDFDDIPNNRNNSDIIAEYCIDHYNVSIPYDNIINIRNNIELHNLDLTTFIDKKKTRRKKDSAIFRKNLEEYKNNPNEFEKKYWKNKAEAFRFNINLTNIPITDERSSYEIKEEIEFHSEIEIIWEWLNWNTIEKSLEFIEQLIINKNNTTSKIYAWILFLYKTFWWIINVYPFSKYNWEFLFYKALWWEINDNFYKKIKKENKKFSENILVKEYLKKNKAVSIFWKLIESRELNYINNIIRLY